MKFIVNYWPYHLYNYFQQYDNSGRFDKQMLMMNLVEIITHLKVFTKCMICTVCNIDKSWAYFFLPEKVPHMKDMPFIYFVLALTLLTLWKTPVIVRLFSCLQARIEVLGQRLLLIYTDIAGTIRYSSSYL